MTGTTPHDPRAERFAGLLVALRIDRIVVALLATATIVLRGGAVTELLATMALIGVIASAPVRVGWLAQRWLRKGDRVYGYLAVLLFGLPVLGFILSVVV